MKKFKPNLPLCIGLVIFSAAHALNYSVGMPVALFLAMMLTVLALELWGIIIAARSPAFQNSRFRKWKLRLIGKK